MEVRKRIAGEGRPRNKLPSHPNPTRGRFLLKDILSLLVVFIRSCSYIRQYKIEGEVGVEVGGGVWGGFPIHYKKIIFWAGWRGLGGSDTEQSKKAAGR